MNASNGKFWSAETTRIIVAVLALATSNFIATFGIVYYMTSDLERRIDRRFDRIEVRLDKIDSRLDSFGERIAANEARLNAKD